MLKIFKTDLHKYKLYSGKSSISLILTQQGLWAILVYRINNSIFRADIPKLLKNTLLFIGIFFQKLIEIITGISIPYSAQIGDHFYIGHFGGIIINASAVIGNNCNISQGVTIGISGRGSWRGVPRIGNNVYMGANSVIIGNITVGDNAVIGANSLITESVDPNITVVGVPAKKVSDNTSKNYI